MAVLAIPAQLCLAEVKVLAEQKNTKAFIIISAGFGEIDENGKQLEKKIADVVNHCGGTLIGPNSIGVMTPFHTSVFTTPIPELTSKGCDLLVRPKLTNRLHRRRSSTLLGQCVARLDLDGIPARAPPARLVRDHARDVVGGGERHSARVEPEAQGLAQPHPAAARSRARRARCGSRRETGSGWRGSRACARRRRRAGMDPRGELADVRVWGRSQTSGATDLDLLYSDLEPIRAGVSSFAGASMFSVAPSTILDERGENPEDLTVARTTPDAFALIGVTPELGRVYDAADAERSEGLLVISWKLWQRRFGGDPKVLGRRVHLNQRGFQIIGVLPRGTEYPFEAAAWRALDPDELLDDDREARIVARLKPGANTLTANAEVEAVAAALATELPDTHANLGAWIQPLRTTVVNDVSVALWALLGAVGLVLLMACVNTANLLLSRSAQRGHEVAIRMALGATRGRVVALHLTESLLLAAAGGLAGIVLGGWALGALLAISPAIPRLDTVVLDVRVVAVMATVTGLCGVVFGVAPAFYAAASPPDRALREGSRNATTGGGRMRLQSTLVTAEVALSTVLAFLALLLFSTFRTALTFDRGFPTDRLVSVTVSPGHPPSGPDEQRAYFGEILGRVGRLGGVRGATLSSHDILQPLGFRVPVQVEAQEVPVPTPQAYLNVADRSFFQTVGLVFVDGGGFSESGGVQDDAEIVVNERFADLYLPDSATRIGARLDLQLMRGHVTGVVSDVNLAPSGPAPPKAYISLDRFALPGMTLTVRTVGDPAPVIPDIERAVRAVSADVLLKDVRTVEAEIDASVAPERFNMLLVLAFAGLALSLAGVGIYGVTSLSVTMRRGEIGIRRALGANDGNVADEILRRVLRLTLTGVVIGGAGALLGGRLVATLLVGVSPSDPLLFGAVVLILTGTAIAASVPPALGALHVDPREVLE